MPKDSPFFLAKVECPICKTVNEFETVKVGAYIEEGRDEDFCPRNIKWRYPRYQAYNPLAFFAATCSHCFYSREFTNAFKDWKSDNNFRTYRLKRVKEKHLEQLAIADSIVRLIADNIDLPRYPSESAILKLHLAIFDELLNEHPVTLDLGRIYLRIGWVYRAMEDTENPSESLMKGILLEIDNRHRMLSQSVSESRDNLDILASQITKHFDNEDLTPDIRARMVPFREQFQTQLDQLNKAVGSTYELQQALMKLLSEYQSATLGSEAGGEGSFGGKVSFAGFLMDLKGRWDGIVVNEREALEKAVFNYKQAFADGRSIAVGTQQIQASYLIAELSRRIGDYDGAREYFNSTIKHGQEFIYNNRGDRSRTVLPRKILELAIEQGRINLAAEKKQAAASKGK